MSPQFCNSEVQQKTKEYLCTIYVTDIDYKTGNLDGGSLPPVSENIYTPSLYMMNMTNTPHTLPHIRVYICVYIHLCVHIYIYKYKHIYVFMYTGIST